MMSVDPQLMAFLGIFGKKSDPAGIRKHAERVANKRAQAYDRWESIQALAQMKTPEAVAALLPRFTFYVEPSITDQEEKDATFSAIVEVGETAFEPVRDFLRKASSISWPVKVLDKIVPPERVVGELIELLAGMDIEYERSAERKNQVLSSLAEHQDPRIEPVVVRFLEDANETVRFNTVAVLARQAAIASQSAALIACLCTEDSVRVRNRILDAFSAARVSVSPQEEQVKPRLTPPRSLDSGGVPVKKK
jgi:HEAT repeat protein